MILSTVGNSFNIIYRIPLKIRDSDFYHYQLYLTMSKESELTVKKKKNYYSQKMTVYVQYSRESTHKLVRAIYKYELHSYLSIYL